MSKFLEKINSPEDVHDLTSKELYELSDEIREFLIESVSKTGGHLSPNLGVVELTLSLYKRGKNLVFPSGSVSLLSSANICYLLISDIAFVLKSLKSGVKWKFKEAIHRDDSEVTKTTNKYTTYTHMKDI